MGCIRGLKAVWFYRCTCCNIQAKVSTVLRYLVPDYVGKFADRARAVSTYPGSCVALRYGPRYLEAHRHPWHSNYPGIFCSKKKRIQTPDVPKGRVILVYFARLRTFSYSGLMLFRLDHFHPNITNSAFLKAVASFNAPLLLRQPAHHHYGTIVVVYLHIPPSPSRS